MYFFRDDRRLHPNPSRLMHARDALRLTVMKVALSMSGMCTEHICVLASVSLVPEKTSQYCEASELILEWG